MGVPVRFFDGNGNLTEFVIDDLGRIAKQFGQDPDESGNDNGVNELRAATFYVYRPDGSIEHIVETTNQDVSSSIPAGIRTTYEYDERNRVQAITYDATGPNASRTEYAYDATGNISEMTDPGNSKTNFIYDELDRLIATVLPTAYGSTGPRPTYITEYDPLGLVVRTFDAEGNSTQYGYDRAGRNTSVMSPGGSSSVQYDDLGRAIYSRDSAGRTTLYTYDELERLATVASPNDDYGARNVTRYQYDPAGNVRFVTEAYGEPNERTSEFQYDFMHRVEREIDAYGAVTAYDYDEAGNLTDLTDSNGNVTTWHYDALNRVEKETNSAHAGERTTVYDEYGRIEQTKDRNNRVIEFEYDTLHQLDKEIWMDGSSVERVIDYDFDIEGRLTRVSDSDATYVWSYDGLDRADTYTVDLTGLSGSGQTDARFDMTYTGNSLLDTVEANLRSGSNVNFEVYHLDYNYDAANRVSEIIQTNQSAPARINEKRIDFAYNLDGRLDKILRSNLTSNQVVSETTFDYDARGRLDMIHHSDSSDALVAGFDYSYNNLNQLTTMDFLNTAYAGESVTWTYDRLGQLKSANVVSGNDESYSYDANGNRTLANGVQQDIDAGNQLEDDGIYTYTYDDEGNRTSRARSGEFTEYEWDHRNRLVKLTERTSSGGTVLQTVEYGYDAFDQWVSRRVTNSGGTEDTFFVYRDGQIEMEFDSTSVDDLSHRYLWGPGTDQLLAVDSTLDKNDDGTSYWVLTDHLGSVRDLLTLDGNHLADSHVSYDSFGNVTSTPGGTSILFGYTGRPVDGATGLQNNLHRWYDPAVGRWISEDPIGFGGGDANLYRYVGNESTGYVDPDGLEESSIGGGGPSIPRWQRPFYNDPRTDYVGKVPMYDWVVGNLYHRSGAKDVTNQIGAIFTNPIQAIWDNNPTCVAAGVVDTALNWDKISDLEKQDMVAKTAVGVIAGRLAVTTRSAMLRRIAPQTGDVFERTFVTSKGPVDLIAEVEVCQDTLHLKDIAIFGRGSQPLTGLSPEVFAARTRLINDARALGFKRLRISATRVETSSSANPGKKIDRTIDLYDR